MSLQKGEQEKKVESEESQSGGVRKEDAKRRDEPEARVALDARLLGKNVVVLALKIAKNLAEADRCQDMARTR